MAKTQSSDVMTETQKFNNMALLPSTTAASVDQLDENNLSVLELPLFKEPPYILNYISDDRLCEITFSVHLQRMISLLSDSVIISNSEVERQVTYLIQMLWGLFQRSNHSIKQRMAHLVANKPHLTAITLKAMCSYLESGGASRSRQHLLISTHLTYLFSTFIPFHSKIVANIQSSDQVARLLKVLERTDKTPVDATDERGIMATMLMLYSCANKPTMCQLLKQNHCIKCVGQLTQFNSTDIKLISKALVARLIPTDTSSDDMAVLILIKDDEVDHLISMVQSIWSKHNPFPIISVIMDLSRSPHNMWAFASRDVAMVLSNVMDSINEEDQAMSAQMIWVLMEFNYTGNEEVSAIVNNGTLMLLNEDQPLSTEDLEIEDGDNFLSYIITCIKSLEDNIIIPVNTSAVIENLSTAILLVFQLMKMSDLTFRKSITRSIRNSFGAYEAIQALTNLVCFVHYGDVNVMEKKTGYDIRSIVLQCLLWWTCHSETVATELSKTGLISNLINLLRIYIQLNAVEEIRLCIKIFINCASNSSTLPAFNSSYSRSDVIVSVLPLTHGQYSDLALRSKMLLALLNPLLDSENLLALKLTRHEVKSCLRIVSDAITAPCHLTQDISLLTILRAMIFFSHEYYRQNKKAIEKHTTTEYEKCLLTVSSELKSNVQLFAEEGILPVLKSLLDLKLDEEVKVAVLRLFWCLSHSPTVRMQLIESADAIAAIQDMHTQCHPSSELSLPSHCALWLLSVQAKDPHSLLLYAKGCLHFKNYSECIEVCDTILDIEQDKHSDSVILRARVIKGKASFHTYKRKLQYFTVNHMIRHTREGNNILKECCHSMKEAITLLGNALDQDTLDEEGSKLLDWAMIDCLSITNQLNSCKRCLLCRCKQKKSLRDSHVWPKFILKDPDELSSDQNNIFGLNRHHLKASGECTYQMLCERCEELLSQNGENDFKRRFPSSGDITYSSWLYNFCCGLIFRCLSIVVQFPMHFNDDEVYKVLLLCRKHLLSLPVIIQKKVTTPSELESRQLKRLTDQLKGTDLDIFLFVSPLQSQQNYYGTFQVPYPQVYIGLSRNKQLDKASLVFNGHLRFLLLCCGPITLIVQLDQFKSSLINRGFHLKSNPEESDQTYSIPSQEECIKLLPMGVWAMMEQHTEYAIDDFNTVSRFISEKAKIRTSNYIQSTSMIDIPSIAKDSTTLFQVSFLPKEYEIVRPHLVLPRNKSVVLPNGHKTITHAELSVPMQHCILTFLLCMDESKSFSDCLYVLFITQNYDDHTMHVDGATVVVKDNKLIITDYLLHKQMIDKLRNSMSTLQQLLNRVLPNKHFDNIDLLAYLVNSRRCIKGPLAQFLPSLDRKCSPEGCWYCSNLCHNCMQPSSTFYSGVNEENKFIKFCSQECKDLWFYSPDQKPFHMASYMEDTSLSKKPLALAAPLMTIISGSKNCVEQVYLSVGRDSKNVNVPYIVWHIRRLKNQFFAQFYTSKDCLPLNNIWVKHFCTAESEQISYKVASERRLLQSHLQMLFGLAAKKQNFGTLASFMDHIWSKHEVSAHYSMSTATLDQKLAVQSFLPPEFLMINPEIDLSLRIPSSHTMLLHYTEEADSIQTTYILIAANLFIANSLESVQMCIIIVKHHMEEGWYFADGALLSANGTEATEFLHNTSYTKRSQSIEDVNRLVEEIVPEMLREKGIPSISTLLSLTKYTWINPLAVKLDLQCSSSTACWHCKLFCICCSYFLLNPDNGSEYCCDECHAMMKLDPSIISPVVLNPAELAAIFNKKDPPVIAAVKKVITADDTNENTILRIYLSRSDSTQEFLPPGTLFAICQLKTTKTQVVIDCLLSKDYVPLEPVWYSDYCERMIEKYRTLLHHEIALLVYQTLV